MRSIITIAVCSILIFSSCQPEPLEPSMRHKSLTEGRWRIWYSQSIIGYPTGPDTVNLLDYLPNCEEDNSNVFNTDGTTTSYGETIKCTSNEPNSWISSKWQFLNADTQLELKDTARTVVSNVLMLNDTTLRLGYTTTDNNITSYTESYYHNIK